MKIKKEYFIVFDNNYLCGKCTIEGEIKDNTSTDFKMYYCRIINIFDKETLEKYVYSKKESKINSKIVLNDFEIHKKLKLKLLKNMLKEILNQEFNANIIDMIETNFKKELTKITGVSKKIRDQLSKKEWYELILECC